MLRRYGILFVLVLVVSLLLISCTPEAPDNGSDAQQGGTLKIAIGTASTLDLAFLTTAGDNQVATMWKDDLVFCGEDGRPDIDRSVAESWEYDEDEKVWTFKLRENVLFHDGKKMTSRDVKYTFDRLRDPEVGTKTVDLFSNIVDITTPDDYTVLFKLKETNPEFLLDLADRGIMDADNTEPETVANGIGPFMIESFSPEDRVSLVRNPNYWRVDAEGNQLPYLDRLELIVITDRAAVLEALRGGQIDFAYGIPPESHEIVEEDPNLILIKGPSATHHVIRMRTDVAPFDNVLVRQALKLGTDREEILEAAYEGHGVVGRDTPISPAHEAYYLDIPVPKRDVKKAKQLLAEAGYPNGLDITMNSIESRPHSAIAVIWKEQMAEIGVNVDIKLVPEDIYYVDWLEYDLGITDWGGRINPCIILQQAYISDALWNETHWVDPEMDELVGDIMKEMDFDKRVEAYHKVQEIFIERGPIIVPAFSESAWVANKDVKGVKGHFVEIAVDFSSVYLDR